MAKGQVKSNREAKKPKQSKKPTAPAAGTGIVVSPKVGTGKTK